MATRKIGVRLLTFAALGLAGMAMADPVAKGEFDNVISGLDVQQAPQSTRVILEGKTIPVFTVFKLQNPDRLVVDLIRTEFQGIASPRRVEDSRVGEIATTQFRQGGSVVSRVVIALKAGVRFDARAEGAKLIVTISGKDLKPASAVSANQGSEAPALRPPSERPPMPRAPAETAPAKPAPSAEGEPPQKLETVTVAAEEKDFKVVESFGDRRQARRIGVRRISTGNGDAVTIHTSADVAAYEVLEVFHPFRVVVDLFGATMKSKARELSLTGKNASRVRAARHADKVRLVLDFVNDQDRSFRVERIKGGLRIGFDQAPKGAVAVAPARPQPDAPGDSAKPGVVTPVPGTKDKAVVAGGPPPPKDKAVVAAEKPAVGEKVLPVAKASATASVAKAPVLEPSVLQDVTFRQETREARVVLDLKGDATPQVVHVDDRSAVLEIPRCQMPVVLERTLDTSELGSVVQSLSAYRVQSEDKVKLVAVTSGRVPNRLERREGKLNWVFEGASKAAAAPAGSAPTVSSKSGESGESAEYVYAPDEVAGYSVRRPELADGAGGAQPQRRAKYHGRRITLDFKDIDIHNLLRLISDVAKLNIVTSDDVSGKVTLALRNVPWDQALDIVLQTKGLGKVQQGNIIRVARQETLVKEREAALKAVQALKPLEPLRVRILAINNAAAAELEKQVKEVLSERGKVSVDERTNVLIVKDVLESLVKAEGLVRSLDTETPQVLIEARIVEANTQYKNEVGVQWGGDLGFSSATGNPTGLPFPNTIGVTGGSDDMITNTTFSGTANPGHFAVNLPATVGAGAGGAVGFIFGSAGGAAHLNLRLSALENRGVLKIISAPKITTLDNKKAKIGQGLSIPISVVSAAGVNTVFIEAKLELEVTPHITQDGSVLLAIKVAKNEPDFSRLGARGDPTIIKKEAETQVMVRDGDTTVIGGIFTRKSDETVSGIPVLSNIPILGWFFRSSKQSDERTELLIFITPRLVNRLQSTVSQK